MRYSTVFKKGSAKQIKAVVTSPRKAQRLSKAIVKLETVNMKKLLQTGKVKQIKATGGNSYYVYRISPTERLVFSNVNGKNYIHDVVSAKSAEKVHSLFSAAR